MRVALLSDMHGNAVGLDAVLAEWAPEPVDEIVSLGDVAQGGAQPAEVVDRLRGLGCRSVFGNSDEFLLTLDVDVTGEELDKEARERVLRRGEWTRERLGPERLELLPGVEPVVPPAGAGEGRLFCAPAP